MLGKVMEGAWIELGLSLAKAGHAPAGLTREAFEQELIDGQSVASKVRGVNDVFVALPKSHLIRQTSGISPTELRSAVLWSDSLRETRNAIHFGVAPTTAYTYEGVAVLLVHGATSLKMLYRIKKAADS